MRWFRWLCLLCLSVLAYGCNGAVSVEANSPKAEMVSLACWNAQTFFDAEVDGSEYSDYQNMGKWSRDKYFARLGRMREVMTALNADVFVLEEIENAAVVQDIANQLSGVSWDKNKCWSYGAFVRSKGSSIGCGVFSRYELKDLKMHFLDVSVLKNEQPEMRPLMELTVDAGGKEFVLFVNHWKSKLGGEDSSEVWRDWQECLLSNSICEVQSRDEKMALVACGDFNRDAKDFVCDFTLNGFNTILRGKENVKLYSPWFTDSGNYTSDAGSYYYNEDWERIDNIFSGGQVQLSAFGPKTEGNWAGGKGIPNSYKIYSGEGYSDHLPLMCVLSLL